MKRLHKAPLAVASDGTLLVNLVEFGGVTDLQSALGRARLERGRVFIGVELTPKEALQVRRGVEDRLAEGAGRVVGARQRGRRLRAK